MDKVLAIQVQGKVKVSSPAINILPGNSHSCMVGKHCHFIENIPSSRLVKRCSSVLKRCKQFQAELSCVTMDIEDHL